MCLIHLKKNYCYEMVRKNYIANQYLKEILIIKKIQNLITSNKTNLYCEKI